MVITMGEVVTINETDFIWMNGVPEGIEKAILFDAVGSDHVPAVVGASFASDESVEEPVGYMTSKHISSSPHTMLSSGFTGWPIYYGPDKKTLVIEVLTPAHISKDMGAQKNAWLFNYPPARDVAHMLVTIGCENFCVLTSDAFDVLRGEHTGSICVVKGEDIGRQETLETDSLQTLWGWLPAFMFAVEKKGAHVMVIPSHGQSFEPKSYGETFITEAIRELKLMGFNTNGCHKRAKELYERASSESVEAAKLADDVITKMRNKARKATQYEGGMFG